MTRHLKQVEFWVWNTFLNHEAPNTCRGVLLRYHSQGSQRVNRVYDVRLLTYVRPVYRSSRKKTQSSVRPAYPFVVEETAPTRSRCSNRSLCHGNLLDYTSLHVSQAGRPQQRVWSLSRLENSPSLTLTTVFIGRRTMKQRVAMSSGASGAAVALSSTTTTYLK